MDTKSKSFSYSTFSKSVALIMLFFMIFTVSTVFFYAVYYGGFIAVSDYYQTSVFRNNISRILIHINQRETVEAASYAHSLKYTAYDEAGQILQEYSNAHLKESDFKASDCVLDYTYRDDQHILATPAGTKLWNKDMPFKFHFNRFLDDENQPLYHRIVLLFDYQNDKGALGQSYHAFENFKQTQDKVIVAGVIAFFIGLIIVVYLLVVTGKKYAESAVALNFIDKIPLEFIALLVTGLFFMLGVSIKEIGYMLNNHSLPYHDDLVRRLLDYRIFFLSLAVTLILMAGFILVKSVVRSLKASAFFKRIFCLQLLLGFFKLFSIKRWHKMFKPIFALYLLGYAMINIILVGMSFSGSGSTSLLGFFSFIAFNGFSIYWLLKQLQSLKHVIDYTDDVVNRGTTTSFDATMVVPLLKPFAQNINKLKDGLSIAIDNAVKNERMRSELITNVTHDLKNPLTSIIGYADLLAKENIENDNANQYIGVISEKSNRLKDLIDHLVDASKLSSGVGDINLEEVDLVALSKQLQGEYHEAFTEKKLEFVIQTKLESALIRTDTKHYTRILDNLFSNVIKYAMPGTRVYYTIDTIDDGYQVCLKNISNHPLNISAEELTERFVRGDTARSTEGNGLGLSIAKSLAYALGASFEFYIDGDLFKACLVHCEQNVVKNE